MIGLPYCSGQREMAKVDERVRNLISKLDCFDCMICKL